MVDTTEILLRPYEASDSTLLVELFRASVRELAASDYSPAQILAWAPDTIDAATFGQSRGESWIAEISGRLAGFADLEADGHVKMLYVQPTFARRSVAQGLLQHLESLAHKAGIRRLYTEASITALAAFEKAGFCVVVPQLVTVRGETMKNFRMEKRLNR